MKFNFGESFGILLKTMPYVIMRMVIYGLLGIGAGLIIGFLLLLAKIFGGFGTLLFIAGLAGLFGLLQLVKRYVLYMINAGHIAVITELIHKGTLPPGINQVEYGKQTVTRLFKEVNVLFLVDQMVSGIIKAFNRMVVRIADILPIPGLDSVAKFINSVLNFSMTYVDESILSYNLSRENENIWESSKRGVVLYAQNWKPIVTSALGLAIVNIVATAAFILVMLVPFAPMALMTSNETLKTMFFLMAVTVGYGLKLSVVNPFCLISMILTYNKAIENQEPNPEWEAKLEMASAKFKELKARAMETISPKPVQPIPPEEPESV